MIRQGRQGRQSRAVSGGGHVKQGSKRRGTGEDRQQGKYLRSIETGPGSLSLSQSPTFFLSPSSPIPEWGQLLCMHYHTQHYVSTPSPVRDIGNFVQARAATLCHSQMTTLPILMQMTQPSSRVLPSTTLPTLKQSMSHSSRFVALTLAGATDSFFPEHHALLYAAKHKSPRHYSFP